GDAGAEQVRRRAEAPPPRAVGQDEQAALAARLFVRREVAAERGAHAERGQEAGGDRGQLDLLRAVRRLQVGDARVEGGAARERRGLRDQVQIVRRRQQ